MNIGTKNNLLTLAQAAQRLSICKRTLEREIAAGRFPRPLKIATASRVLEADLEAYLTQRIGERSQNSNAMPSF